MTEDVLNKEYNVSMVVHGNTISEPDLDGSDPYKVSFFLCWVILNFLHTNMPHLNHDLVAQRAWYLC